MPRRRQGLLWQGRPSDRQPVSRRHCPSGRPRPVASSSQSPPRSGSGKQYRRNGRSCRLHLMEARSSGDRAALPSRSPSERTERWGPGTRYAGGDGPSSTPSVRVHEKTPGAPRAAKNRCSRRIPGGEQSKEDRTRPCSARQTASGSVRQRPAASGPIPSGTEARSEAPPRETATSGPHRAGGSGQFGSGSITPRRTSDRDPFLQAGVIRALDHDDRGRTSTNHEKTPGRQERRGLSALGEIPGGKRAMAIVHAAQPSVKGLYEPSGPGEARKRRPMPRRGREGAAAPGTTPRSGFRAGMSSRGAIRAPYANNPRGARSVEASLLLARSRGGDRAKGM